MTGQFDGMDRPTDLYQIFLPGRAVGSTEPFAVTSGPAEAGVPVADVLTERFDPHAVRNDPVAMAPVMDRRTRFLPRLAKVVRGAPAAAAIAFVLEGIHNTPEETRGVSDAPAPRRSWFSGPVASAAKPASSP